MAVSFTDKAGLLQQPSVQQVYVLTYHWKALPWLPRVPAVAAVFTVHTCVSCTAPRSNFALNQTFVKRHVIVP